MKPIFQITIFKIANHYTDSCRTYFKTFDGIINFPLGTKVIIGCETAEIDSAPIFVTNDGELIYYLPAINKNEHFYDEFVWEMKENGWKSYD